ncbi:unnamed protein product [Cutaneotrichosporon oleaginosum]
MQAAAIGLEEVRIYGLNKTITTEALGEFLGKSVRLRGILLHSQTKGAFQWAQVWVSTEAEVARLLRLREAFAANGMLVVLNFIGAPVDPSTISRVGTGPSTTPSPLADTWDFVSQLSRPRVAPPGFGISLAQPSPFNPTDNTSSQPRNLYVLNLPLNLTHGFVLMSTHHEAIEAMRQMNGKWIDARLKTCSIDPYSFPDAETITTIFSTTFGPIHRVIKISDTAALIQFDNNVSAHALAHADGLQLGERILKTRVLSDRHAAAPNFDPFATESLADHWFDGRLNPSEGVSDADAKVPSSPHSPSISPSTVRLSAHSRPFVPSILKKKLDMRVGSPRSAPSTDSTGSTRSTPSSDASCNTSPCSKVGSDHSVEIAAT